MSYTVLNIGNTRAAATQAVTIEGPFGIVPVTAPSPEDVLDLLPGERWRVTVTVDYLPPLLWLATHITLAPIPPPDFAPANAIEPTTADAVTAAVPWSQLALIVCLAAAIFWRIHLHRTRKQREEARVHDAVSKALAETVQ